jgi:hypothetical protein
MPLTGLATWDYDNDGCLDIVTWGQRGLNVWHGASDGAFHPAVGLFSRPPALALDCSLGDEDGDGDLDLLAATTEGVVWYLNEGGNQNHWLDVVVQPEANPEQFPDLRVNMQGIGSLLELRIGPVCQSRVVSRLPVHFGLGQSPKADVLQLRWTNGLICTRLDPPAGQLVRVEQVLKGM